MLNTQLIRDRLKAATGTLAIDTPPTAQARLLEQLYLEVAKPCQYKPYYWDLCTGLCTLDVVERQLTKQSTGQGTDVIGLFEFIQTCPDQALFLVVNLQEFLPGGMVPNVGVLQHLLNASHNLKRSNKRLILIGSGFQLTHHFDGVVYEMEHPLPTEEEREKALKRQIKAITTQSTKTANPVAVALDARAREELVRAIGGLTTEEADDLLLLASFQQGRIDGNTARFINEQRVMSLKRQNLELWLPYDLLPAVGFDQFDAWCERKRRLYHPDARQYGLSFPNGVVLFGPTGTGKTLAAKNLALAWQMPVLKLNLSQVFTSALGGSEQNLKRLLRAIEQLSCLVLIDEIDKQFASVATNTSGGDGGTSQRLFADFLQWLGEKREKQVRSFLIATANDLTRLPPEMFRDGRWDGLFYVGLPEQKARVAILKMHLEARQSHLSDEDLERLALTTKGMSGAELEQQIVLQCAEQAFANGKPGQVTLTALLQAAGSATALSRDPTRRSEIAQQLAWAAQNALFASSDTQALVRARS